MERQELNLLFEAIKKDDLKSFSSIMISKSDLNICFGRFPILSLLYLYGSYKILEKYEKFLLPIHNYNVVEEYYDAYLRFKKHAKKSLKLYVFNEKIIYPIEMLAILDERFLLDKYYKKLYKNEDIVKNIRKIYNLNRKIDIDISQEDVKLPKKKISLKQKLFAAGVVAVLTLVIAFSSVSLLFIKNRSGIGLASAPVKVSTEQELQTAIKKGGRYYELQNDIVLTKEFEAFNFSGHLDGNGYEIVATTFLDDGFVSNLTGSISNLVITAEIKNKNVSTNFAVLAKKSSGKVSGVEISAEIDWQAHNDEDVYLAGLVAENSGTVEDSKIEIYGTLNNNRSSNVYFAGVVGLNDGVVKNCTTVTARVQADTVDMGGIVAVNNNLIEKCSNDITLVQTSAKEWHPNTAGVCITNHGKIDGCVNTAEVSAESTVATKSGDSDYAVIVGGIVCDNYGGIYNSKNSGKIVAKGDISVCYAGGVAARNILTDVRAIIEKCQSSNDEENIIFAFSKSGLVCVGGIVGHNSSEVVKSGFVGNIDANTNFADTTKVACYVGGVVGYNAECALKENYARVVYLNREATKEKENYFFGMVVGFVGPIRYDSLDMFYTYTANGLTYVEGNRFVVDASCNNVAIGAVSQVYMNQIMSTQYTPIQPDAEKMIAYDSLDNLKLGLGGGWLHG